MPKRGPDCEKLMPAYHGGGLAETPELPPGQDQSKKNR